MLPLVDPECGDMNKRILFFLIMCSGWLPEAVSQSEVSLETIIGRTIGQYPFSPANALRLSAYAELKGRYEQSPFSLTLPFGYLGSLRFYGKSCLLRTEDGRVFTLDPHRDNAAQAQYLDAAISGILERIMLLGDQDVDPAKRAFVDQHLARKHIEPFAKLYVRHLLLHYGRYDAYAGRLTLHTDWLPVAENSRSESDTVMFQKPADPLMIKLDGDILRGYYIRSGGTVYVENIDRKTAYASGEEYAYNVAAFKLFAQKMFSQTTQFITTTEKARLVSLIEEPASKLGATPSSAESVPAVVDLGTPRMESMGRTRGASRPSTSPAQSANVRDLASQRILPPGYRQQKANRSKPGPQLYGPGAWIQMMLTILRQKGFSISDPDILPYFIDQPYFTKIYERLTAEERAEVDAYLD